MFNKRILLLLILLSIFISCGEKLTTVDLYMKGTRLIVECARTPDERSTGLMYRKKLGPRQGMLFIFPGDVQTSFWMKNTYLPLSIAFLSEDGEILDIKDMSPLSTDLVGSRYPYRYALEVNQGLFSDLGIQPGDYVVFPKGFPGSL